MTSSAIAWAGPYLAMRRVPSVPMTKRRSPGCVPVRYSPAVLASSAEESAAAMSWKFGARFLGGLVSSHTPVPAAARLSTTRTASFTHSGMPLEGGENEREPMGLALEGLATGTVGTIAG